MALYYEHQIHIDSRDVDGNGHCRPSALLGHLQEAATLENTLEKVRTNQIPGKSTNNS